MKISAVTQLLTECWMRAEENTRFLIHRKYWSENEEFITELFYGELREALEMASKEKKFEKAFLHDLYIQFPSLRTGRNLRITEGIEASIVKHERHIEARTGGDFSLLIARPLISKTNRGIKIINHNYYRGILCQAKLKRCSPAKKSYSHWGGLTRNQKKILSDRTAYLTLLLYEYLDTELRELDSFYWQLCSGVTLDKITQWLKLGNFPNKVRSDEIISKLCCGEIGTDDPEIISEFINPKTRNFLIVKIGWSDNKKPPDDKPILAHQMIRQTSRIYTAQKKNSHIQLGG